MLDPETQVLIEAFLQNASRRHVIAMFGACAGWLESHGVDVRTALDELLAKPLERRPRRLELVEFDPDDAA